MVKTIRFLSVCLLALSTCLTFFPGVPLAKTTYVSIGTGGMTGVYYPTGGAIAQMVNKKKGAYGISCTYQSTGGSVFNVNAVMAGDLEFGIVQSDRQYQAVHGAEGSEWAGRPQKKLRAVFSIHAEAVTLVAAVDAGIETVTGLKGKRVNIGNPGSGHRQNAIHALGAVGMDYRRDLVAESVKAAEAPGLLQDGRIDAFFYTVGHPSGTIKEATAGRRKVRLVPLTGIDTLLATYPYYSRATVPAAYYPGAENTGDAQTFGVRATLVSSADVPDEVVYAVTREIFENLEEFKALHAAYVFLTRAGMLTGLSAPIHPGALKYYREAGLK